MKTEKPTPIPRRASARKKAPEPIEFPAPPNAQYVIRTGDGTFPVDTQMRPLYANANPQPPISDNLLKLIEMRVHEALRDHDRLLIHTFYKVVMDWPLAEIMCMGEAEFEARCRSILEDEE